MSAWKLAFITGGGSGIGRRMAELLLAEGTSVAVFDRNNSAEVVSHLEAIAAKYPAVRCTFFTADVTDENGLNNAVEQAVEATNIMLSKTDLAELEEPYRAHRILGHE